jgi:N-acetylglucosaminyldiphosphoundecaprenol N-acetyl-beta-D-mannosaminyltransferase
MSKALLSGFDIFTGDLNDLADDKLIINTINAHSFNITQDDNVFAAALRKSDVLIPDGISVVWAIRFLTGRRMKKIAGADLFFYELSKLSRSGGSCFFLGSSDATLQKIAERAAAEYPGIKVGKYSPPYKPEFSEEDNRKMIEAVNAFKPDVVFVGMTAPKQEKWAYLHKDSLDTKHICCIGAVFDFYAGTITRAPDWMIRMGLEWFYRLIREPSRMWKRYLIGNTKFIWLILKEKSGFRKAE